MKVDFATSNKFKVDEANEVGKKFGIEFVQISQNYPEIRAENVEDVALDGARYVYKNFQKPVIVEDTGMYITALNGFPGSYSKFVFQKIGNEGILRLLHDKKDRSATFISAIGYFDGKILETFVGKVEGNIVEKNLGSDGFGYDPIFLPKGYKKTFAEDYEVKKKISHRTKAFEKFCEWLTTKQ